jgi:hypothetical protein
LGATFLLNLAVSYAPTFLWLPAASPSVSIWEAFLLSPIILPVAFAESSPVWAGVFLGLFLLVLLLLSALSRRAGIPLSFTAFLFVVFFCQSLFIRALMSISTG